MPPSERGEAWPGSGDVVVATAQGHLLLSPQYPVSGASSPRLAGWPSGHRGRPGASLHVPPPSRAFLGLPLLSR